MGQEAIKLIGAVLWVVGVGLLLVDTGLAVVVLLVAVLITVMLVQKTREKRHKELLEAMKSKGQ